MLTLDLFVCFRDCRVVRDPQTLKSKGYGFVSFVKKAVSTNPAPRVHPCMYVCMNVWCHTHTHTPTSPTSAEPELKKRRFASITHTAAVAAALTFAHCWLIPDPVLSPCLGLLPCFNRYNTQQQLYPTRALSLARATQSENRPPKNFPPSDGVRGARSRALGAVNFHARNN